MVKRTGTTIRKSRSKRTKNIREKGKLSLTSYFQGFKKGEKVCLKVNPGVQEGVFPFRFQGKVGIVKEKKGRCYTVSITDSGKAKQLNIHPVHLKRA